MQAVLSTGLSALLLFLLLGVVDAAEVSHAEVAADCRAEGKAMGVPDEDLDGYVKECIAEFLGTTMVNHQPRTSSSH